MRGERGVGVGGVRVRRGLGLKDVFKRPTTIK